VPARKERLQIACFALGYQSYMACRRVLTLQIQALGQSPFIPTNPSMESSE